MSEGISLLEKARSASAPKRSRCNTDRWLDVSHLLRSRGWSWVQIYDFLKSEGEPVQAVRSSFVSSMSRRYMNWMTKRAEHAVSKS